MSVLGRALRASAHDQGSISERHSVPQRPKGGTASTLIKMTNPTIIGRRLKTTLLVGPYPKEQTVVDSARMSWKGIARSVQVNGWHTCTPPRKSAWKNAGANVLALPWCVLLVRRRLAAFATTIIFISSILSRRFTPALRTCLSIILSNGRCAKLPYCVCKILVQ